LADKKEVVMKADKDKITRLLKTARGQIDGLLKMVEDDRYCIDISNQLSATQAILQKVNNEIIQSHLKSCVKDSFDTGSEEDKDEKIEEIVKLLDKLSK
jgi:DNA-binding FrmR family transcriptional regulator